MDPRLLDALVGRDAEQHAWWLASKLSATSVPWRDAVRRYRTTLHTITMLFNAERVLNFDLTAFQVMCRDCPELRHLRLEWTYLPPDEFVITQREARLLAGICTKLLRLELCSVPIHEAALPELRALGFAPWKLREAGYYC